MVETQGAHVSGGDALHRLYQPGIWRAIHLVFHLSVHAFEKIEWKSGLTLQ